MANSFVLYMWMNAQCVCEKNSHKFNSQLDRFLNRKIKCCPWWHQGKAPIIELYNNPSSPLTSPFLSPLLLSLLLFLPLFFSSFSPCFHSPCHPSPTSPLKLQTCSLLGSDPTTQHRDWLQAHAQWTPWLPLHCISRFWSQEHTVRELPSLAQTLASVSERSSSHSSRVLPFRRVSEKSQSMSYSRSLQTRCLLSQPSVFWQLLVMQSESVFWNVYVSLASDVLGGQKDFLLWLIACHTYCTKKTTQVVAVGFNFLPN